MFLQFLLSVSKKKKKEKETEKGNHDWVNTRSTTRKWIFRCIKSDRWMRRHPSRNAQTNGPHNRKKNTLLASPLFPLVVGFRDSARERFSTGFSRDESSAGKKKRRDGRVFRGRRSSVYVIAGWWTLVYLRKRAKQVSSSSPFRLRIIHRA